MASPENDLQARLNRLRELREQGLLDDAEYAAARRAALDEGLPAAPDDPSPKSGVPTKGGTGSHDDAPARRRKFLTIGVIASIVALVTLLAVVLVMQGGDDASVPVADAAGESAPPQRTPQPLVFRSSCSNDRVCPVITSLTGVDTGASIAISMRYCDRTDGAVQGFVYTFRLYSASGRATPWSDSIVRSQTRACNTITSNLPNNYAPGEYQVRATIANSDTGQESTGRSDGFVIG